jgi:hypothetical protein
VKYTFFFSMQNPKIYQNQSFNRLNSNFTQSITRGQPAQKFVNYLSGYAAGQEQRQGGAGGGPTPTIIYTN